MELLQSYRWPGNVRELANAVERAVILSRGQVLRPAAFLGHFDDAQPEATYRGERVKQDLGPQPTSEPAILAPESSFDLEELEGRAIQRALAATGGNRVRAAKLLGISERTLRNKLKAAKSTEPS
jgi:DNA-binding NtrC family response regulator